MKLSEWVTAKGTHFAMKEPSMGNLTTLCHSRGLSVSVYHLGGRGGFNPESSFRKERSHLSHQISVTPFSFLS